jgi:hypothetical protein
MTGFPAVNEGERYGTMQYLNDSHDEIKKIKAHYDFTMIPASKKKKRKKRPEFIDPVFSENKAKTLVFYD